MEQPSSIVITQMRHHPSSPTGELVALIIEFLKFHNFARALQALELDWKAAEAHVAEGIISAQGLSKNLTQLMVCSALRFWCASCHKLTQL